MRDSVLHFLKCTSQLYDLHATINEVNAAHFWQNEVLPPHVFLFL